MLDMRTTCAQQCHCAQKSSWSPKPWKNKNHKLHSVSAMGRGHSSNSRKRRVHWHEGARGAYTETGMQVRIHGRSHMAMPCVGTDSLSFRSRTSWVTLGHLMVLFDLQLLVRSQDKPQSQEKPLTMLFVTQAMLPMTKMGEFFPPLHRPEYVLHHRTFCIALTRKMFPERSDYPVQIHSQSVKVLQNQEGKGRESGASTSLNCVYNSNERIHGVERGKWRLKIKNGKHQSQHVNGVWVGE